MKTIAWYIVIGLVGIGIVVGVVLFLRSRSLPTDEPVVGLNTGGTARPAQRLKGQQKTTTKDGQPALLRQITPVERMPQATPYVEGGAQPPAPSIGITSPVVH